MSVVLRSHKEAVLHRRLASVDDRAVDEFRSDLSTKINGMYDVVDGHFVAIFVSDSQIFVRVDTTLVALQRGRSRVFYARGERQCVFSIANDEEAFAEITYDVPSDPILTGQLFNYVPESDLDIGLAIYEISSDLQRQRQVMLVWR